ncbi:MAG: NAD-dependent epimerase/dehydratase family protein [Candidatus Paceibacterota bacterium]|jgi:UDP-2-acetamido-2,6-beta-L-arabino-hexul-4-ose reductase
MIHIGITGSTGLVGSHLNYYLEKYTDEYKPVLIDREDFKDDPSTRAEHGTGQRKKLIDKLKVCDVIVHLAGLSNRADQKEIYDTNVGLTRKILDRLESLNLCPKIIFLSSVHRDKDTPYGRSKKDSELLIAEWGKKNNTPTTIIISPHIFGESPHIFNKSLKPYVGSAFATFCHELAQNKPSTVYPIAPIELVYVGDVVVSIFNASQNTTLEPVIYLHGKHTQMADVYSLLKYFRDEILSGKTPVPKDDFELNCYKAFLSYV